MRVLTVLLTLLVGIGTSASAQTAVVEYYHPDGVGSVRAVTNQAGQVVRTHNYFAFGDGPDPAPPSAQDPLRFAGKPRDAETGLDYFGARHYRARSGRFTTVDPVMDQQKAVVDPQQWNRYAYVRNNPLRYIDPDGAEITTPAGFFTKAYQQQNADNLRALGKVVINIGRSINSPGHMTPEAEARHFEQADSAAEASRMRFFDLMLTAAPLLGRRGTAAPRITESLASTRDLQATHGMTMSGRQFARLKADIAKNGIQDPIKYTEYNGQKFVVDGHHRLRAAQALGIRNVPTQRVNLPYAGYRRPEDLINMDR